MAGSDLCKKERAKWKGDENHFDFVLFSRRAQVNSLVFILNTLDLTYSELAVLLGVSRPVFCKWIDGDVMPLENQRKLDGLLKIADQVEQCNFKRIRNLIHRKIFDFSCQKHSLFEMILDYRDITEALETLKESDEKEDAARAELKGSGRDLRSLDDAMGDV